MRYLGGADVDGRMEVALQTANGSSLVCYPSALSKSKKNNFDEAQKLTWREIRCLHGLKTMITSNHISELLKMQIESKSQNVHTQGTLSGFISKHAVTTQKSINMRDSHKVIIALSLCLSSGALQHTVNTSIIAAKMV